MKAKETKTKESIFKKTSFFVCSYIALVGLLMVAEVLHKFVTSVFGIPLNMNAAFPIEAMATAMVAVCAGYCGLDRAAFASFSAQMEYGVSNVGNPKSLRNVIYWSTLIFLESVILTVFFDVTLPVQTLGVALGTEVAIYVTGNKAITLCGSINGKVTTPTAADSYSQRELRELEIKGQQEQANTEQSTTADDIAAAVETEVPAAK